MWYSQNFFQFGIHREKLKSKILSAGYARLSSAKLDNVAKFNSPNYLDFINVIYDMAIKI